MQLYPSATNDLRSVKVHSWMRRRRVPTGLLVFALLAATSLRPTCAINIVVHLENEGQNPSYDPSGSRLLAIANAAATYWEDVLPQSGTYDVDIWWDADEFTDSPGTLARWNFQLGGNDNIRINPNPTANGAPAQWWFDPTPLDNNEFDFTTRDRVAASGGGWIYRGGQWLYRDVDSNEQNSWFDGNPPGLLEIGYRGRAIDSTIRGQYDLLSTVIHELGHELGVNDSGGPWEALPAFVNGASVTFVEDPDGGHLAARTSLMCEGCGLLGTRRFPSAMDIMAVADDEGFTQIDLPRKDFIKSSADWNTNSSWIGNRVPDSSDDVYFRNGGQSTMSADDTVNNLNISAQSRLSTTNRNLAVGTDTTINGALFESPRTRLTVSSGGTFTTGALFLNGGVLELAGGSVDIGIQAQVSNFPSLITGHGKISAPTIVNNGTIEASGGTLSIIDLVSATFGGTTGQGVLNARSGNLTLTALLTPQFQGTMNIGADRNITFTIGWQLGTSGDVNLEGTGVAATLAGGKVTAAGTISVDGLGVISAPVQFEPSAEVLIPEGTLRLTGETTFKGGGYFGLGTMVQRGNATVVENTQIDVATYDWDGDGPVSTTTINAGRNFVVNAVRIEPSSASGDGFDGTVNVNGGTLDVRTHTFLPLPGGGSIPFPLPWRMEGVMNLSTVGPSFPTVTGSPMVVGESGMLPFLGTADINALSGLARIESPVTFESRAAVNVASDTRLRLQGNTIYQGGSFNGAGTIEQWGNSTVEANTQIDTRIYDMDGQGSTTITINPTVSFVVDSLAISPGDPAGGLFVGGENSFDGTLNVNSGVLDVRTHDVLFIPPGGTQRLSRAWRMKGTLNLNRASRTLPTVTGSSLIIGEPNAQLPPALLTVDGGPATIDTAQVTFESNSELQLDLAGTLPGDFEQINMTGRLQLGGKLKVALAQGFAPQAGNTFPILTAGGGVTGMFSSLVLPTGLQWNVQYNANDVVLQVLQEMALAGDYNDNGQVEQGDLDLVLLNWGASTPPVPNGWVNDLPLGTIDQAELDKVLLNWGNAQAAGGLASIASSAVPEPPSWVAAFLVFGLLIAWDRARSAKNLSKDSRVRNVRI